MAARRLPFGHGCLQRPRHMLCGRAGHTTDAVPAHGIARAGHLVTRDPARHDRLTWLPGYRRAAAGGQSCRTQPRIALVAMRFGYLRFDKTNVTPAISTIMDRMIMVPTMAAV